MLNPQVVATTSSAHQSNRRLSSLSLDFEYRTGSSDPVSQFYYPCLEASSIYKRAVGYFRSSIFLLTGPAILSFAKRGGRIWLICSPELTLDDQRAIADGYSNREKLIADSLEAEIDILLADPRLEWKVRVLATLIVAGVMEIRIAIRPPSHGLYHEKIGIFADSDGGLVSFIGSANESWSGWHTEGNFESIEVFCSWHAGERRRAERHLSNFDSLWEGTTPNVDTLSFPEAARQKLCTRAATSIDEIEKGGDDNNVIARAPKKRKLMHHQQRAIEQWIQQGRRGVFEHATGSGKTFTALEAMRSHIESGMPALIVVPSDLLLKQWLREAKEEFPEVAIILAGVGNDRWKERGKLRRISSPTVHSGRIIISTMQTAASLAFRQALWQGEHLFIVADEVHQIGSPFNAQCMLIDSGPRLGLSATPQRYGDPEGTARILDYFGMVVPPPFTLADAVAAGRLVEYLYHPHPVRLNAEEADEWKRLTRAIRFEMGNSDEGCLTQKAKMLLIRRSRIAKRCAAKAPLAASILRQSFEEGQGWLVYCEDTEHLEQTMNEIRSVGLNPIQYHSNMDGDRAATLNWFRRFGGVLVSIKCLDEGVDIPSVSHALILASSQNPRQFIQRRGRVLRQSKGKMSATIYDAIVVPIGLNDEPEQASLLKSEFLRAIEFAENAINRSAGAQLREIAREVGFDPDESIHNGYEEEGEL